MSMGLRAGSSCNLDIVLVDILLFLEWLNNIRADNHSTYLENDLVRYGVKDFFFKFV